MDATKAKGRGGKGEEELPMSDEHRVEIERKEDDFVGITEEAVGVMKNVSLQSTPSTILCGTGFKVNRSSIPLSPCATLPISSPHSLNSTRELTRS